MEVRSGPASLSAIAVAAIAACGSGSHASEDAPPVDAGRALVQGAYIKASNTDADDSFGAIAISADGSTLAVGASGESSSAVGVNGDQLDNNAMSSGAVYVFTRTGTTWQQQAYLKASNTQPMAGFGGTVALSADGSTLAVGALQEPSAATGIDGNQADTSAPKAGAVYIFSRANGVWAQQSYIKASNARANSIFGWVALSADATTLVVGAPGESSSAKGIDGNQADVSAPNAGAAYVFEQSAGSWTQTAYIKASNTDAWDFFGGPVAVSADGSTLVVGAGGEASASRQINGDQIDNSADSAGAAYVFVRAGSTWQQQAYLKSSDTAVGDDFGRGLAVSNDGNTTAISATRDCSAFIGDGAKNGATYIFRRTNAAWSQVSTLVASNHSGNDGFGASPAMSANGATVVVGAVCDWSDATGIDGDQFDRSAMCSGAAYLFENVTTSPTQIAYIKASNTAKGAVFGSDAVMTPDAATLIISAPYEASAATGIDGNEHDTSAPFAGAVYVFQ